MEGIVTVGNCLGGNCDSGELSGRELSGGNCLGGNSQGGIVWEEIVSGGNVMEPFEHTDVYFLVRMSEVGRCSVTDSCSVLLLLL